MKHLFFIPLLFCAFSLTGQTKPDYESRVPAHYQLKDVNGDDGAKFIADLDKDGQNDLAIIYTKDDFNSAALMIFLSSSFKNEKTFQMCDWTHMINDFYYENGVLKLSAVDMGKFLTELELKYNPTTKNMVIYKYGEDDLTKKPPFQLKTIKFE